MATGDVLARWSTRPDFSGEWAASGATLLQRFTALNETTGTTRTLPDANGVDVWTITNFASTAGLSAGRWGNNLSLNRSAPATEKTSAKVPYRAGLWPSSGKLLFSVWGALNFSMTYTPLISTRNDAARKPLVYLSTMNDGRPRAMIYDAAGTAILDASETAASIPWTQTVGTWVCYLWMVDLTAKTSQIAMVKRDTGQSFLGPVRTFTGTPNAACTADFVVGTLDPVGAYWATGYLDEVGYWQAPTASLTSVVDGIVRALPARGSDSVSGAGLTVTDAGVTASAAATLLTGAQPAAWTARPLIRTTPSLATAPTALLSTDAGATWATPTTLPVAFNGLVRWQATMAIGETLTKLEVIEQPAQPVLNAGTMLPLGQNATTTAALTGTWLGTPTFHVSAPSSVTATITGTTLTITSGWTIGDFPVTVTVTDAGGLTSEPAMWTASVQPPNVVAAPNPVYARAPLIVYDATDARAVVIADPADAVLAHEVNGERALTFKLPERHPGRPAVVVERIVEAAGELYRVRRITSYRDRGVPMIEAYCEARFYDLGTAGQVDAQSFNGVQAGAVIATILTGTSWQIGAVNVSTSRTWNLDEGSPLACLRQVAKVHGGDLVFDNAAKTVSLLTFSGNRNGLTFFYGHGVTGAKRVEDTTTLATRIYARNADGVTIAEVNNGIPYLEDYTWTTALRSAVYDFASGTSPYTMLAMTQAAIGKRSRPSYSYDVDVIDLSAWSSQDLDRFGAGDEVTVVDADLGIVVTSRIVRMDYDLARPWASKITLSEKLRELGDGTSSDAGVLTTGTNIDTRDLVPFNLLLNARFDNGLAHWAASGATVVPQGATGLNAVELAGGGERWIEQTVAPDSRDVYTLSFQMDASGYPQGVTPELTIVAEVTYVDGTTETVTQTVT